MLYVVVIVRRCGMRKSHQHATDNQSRKDKVTQKPHNLQVFCGYSNQTLNPFYKIRFFLIFANYLRYKFAE